jgi:hypothetical protein
MMWIFALIELFDCSFNAEPHKQIWLFDRKTIDLNCCVFLNKVDVCGGESCSSIIVMIGGKFCQMLCNCC